MAQSSSSGAGGSAGAGAASHAAASDATVSVEVFYHSNFLGRGHGPVLLLEDAGASYKRLPKDGLTDAKVFAMPAIRLNGTRVISQTVAILMALGTEFGYAPPAGMEPEALKLALDLADVWSESYAARRAMTTAAEADEYMHHSGRLARLLAVINTSIVDYGKGGDYMFGAKPCYVDFSGCNVLMLLEFFYGPERTGTLLATVAPVLREVTERVRSRPKVRAYLASDRNEPLMYSRVSVKSLTA